MMKINEMILIFYNFIEVYRKDLLLEKTLNYNWTNSSFSLNQVNLMFIRFITIYLLN